MKGVLSLFLTETGNWKPWPRPDYPYCVEKNAHIKSVKGGIVAKSSRTRAGWKLDNPKKQQQIAKFQVSLEERSLFFNAKEVMITPNYFLRL